jgi:hypothetical protein
MRPERSRYHRNRAGRPLAVEALLAGVIAAASSEEDDVSYNEHRGEGTSMATVDCDSCCGEVRAEVEWDGGERTWTCPDCGASHWQQVDDDGQVVEL